MTASAPPAMTPERWHSIDHILQAALTCTRDHRDAFVVNACGDDTSLRTEVSSLLAAYDATPADFLERPAMQEHGSNSETASPPPSVTTTAPPQPIRMVTARLALYATAAAIMLGVVTGWSLAHSPSVERWREAITAIRQMTLGNRDIGATTRLRPAGTGAWSLVIVDRAGQDLA